MASLFAVDTGGTFTDLVAFDPATGRLARAKHLTTYGDLLEGVMACIGEAGVDLPAAMLAKHGTTLVINTLLQRSGVVTALLTTRGFRDTLEIGRGNRAKPFVLGYRRDPPLVPRPLRFEVDERIDAKGKVLVPLDRDAIVAIAAEMRAAGVEAVAVSFLNAYVDPRHEEAAAALLAAHLPGVYVSTGTALSREWYEFERTATVAANAYVGPRMRRYAERLDGGLRAAGFARTFYMMGSNGGVLSVERSIREPVALIESGPIGGCIGAAAYAEALGLGDLIAFDMGGTTAKCALVEGGRTDIRSPYFVGGYDRGFPIRGAVVDIVEVGAGGGSIAAVDAQARLRVGPRSAGSDPGPVAFGKRGVEPTVTDANLVMGRIGAGAFLGGALRLDAEAARRAIALRVATPLGYGDSAIAEVADGIATLATLTMTDAIRTLTVERGRDPRDFALFAYGGSGPIFAAALARELGIPTVVIPPEPGNFSAVGMLLADARIDNAQTLVVDLDDNVLDEMATRFGAMEAASGGTLAREVAGAAIAFERAAELRYRGQKHALKVPLGALVSAADIRRRFEDAYRRRYGHADAASPVELIGLHVNAHARTPRPDIARLWAAPARPSATPKAMRPVYFGAAIGTVTTPVYDRAGLAADRAIDGPAIVEEYGATTVIGAADRLAVGPLGELRIAIAARTRG
ncbi:MAG: hydantoinase/oxoprolinase family protein [Alphaproteobacteria bacterium]|nr:hydantoinase/oxoprolinase family protein [Alphaproteobacteria bacterium]